MVAADDRLRTLPVALSDLRLPGNSVKVVTTGDVCAETAGAFLGERGREGDVIVAGVGVDDTD